MRLRCSLYAIPKEEMRDIQWSRAWIRLQVLEQGNMGLSLGFRLYMSLISSLISLWYMDSILFSLIVDIGRVG